MKSERNKTRANAAKFISGLPCKKCEILLKHISALISISFSGEAESCRTPNVPDPAQCGVRDVDCHEFEYHGDVNITRDGTACKTWTSNGWTHNKCRNDGYSYVWCYKVGGGWDKCSIRKCEECDKKGEKYFEEL